MCEKDCEHIIGLTGKRRVFMLVGTPDESFNYCPKCGEKLGLDPVEEKGFYTFVVGSA